MNGYVNYSRSTRSAEAIRNFEVPITLINKSLIDSFLNKYQNEFTKDEMKRLKNIKTSIWKFVAKEMMSPTSWHHTSSHYNKTKHYDLETIAEIILDQKNNLDLEYKEFKNKISEKNYLYGIIEVQIWGGSRNHPKIIGTEKQIGIIINDWLYYLDFTIKKYKINANKTINYKSYKNYSELVKANPEYKNKIKYFNKIIKMKGIKI